MRLDVFRLAVPPSVLGERPVRWAPIAALCVAVAIGIVVWALNAGPLGTAYDGVRQPPLQVALADPAPAPPPVEPLVLRTLDPILAQRINAQTPFTQEPIPPAQPFRITGSVQDRARATDCLAAAILYEAGTESLAGQKAVAQVVLNRVRHPAFPKTVCGVVFQGAERTTGCQFTFTCDGSMVHKPSPAAWANMQGLARIMLTGEVFRPVGTATHYHTDWVLPAWSSKLDKVHKEGAHLFFRWAGWWGQLNAFRGRYASAEPVIAQLASLSPAHGALGLQPDFEAEEAQLLATQLDPEAGGQGVPMNPYGFIPALQNSTGDYLVFILPRTADAGLMLRLVLFSCGTKPYCKILVWTDPKLAPFRFPVSDEQLQSLTFSYLRNRSAGIDKALWNCEVLSRPDPNQCMKMRKAPPPNAAPALASPLATP